MKSLSLLTIFFTASSLALSPLHAQAASPSAPAVKETYLDFSEGGQEIHFLLRSKVGQSGALEVNAYFLQNRGLYDTEKLIFYGRDLDGDRYPETWFIRQDIFIPQIIRHDRTDFSKAGELGQDAVKHLVSRIGHLQKDNYFKELFFKVGQIGTSTVADMLEAKEEFVANEVDLSSLQVQINRRKNKLKPGEVLPAKYEKLQAIVEQGYDKNLAQFEKAFEVDYWNSALIETAVDVSIIKVGELISAGGRWVARSMGNMSRAARIAESFEAFSKRIKLKLGVGQKAEALATEAALRATYALSYRAVMAEVRFELRELAAKNFIADKVLYAFEKVGSTYYRGAIQEFGYVAQTQFLQVLAEGYDKWDEIVDPNPIVMAKNLFKDKGFLQDFTFMTHETVLMSGIAAGSGSQARRIAITGLVSFSDSGIMNILIKGEADPKRVGFETGWEVVVGNLQTQLDMNSIKYFTKLAEKQNNPKLKVVGYAIALVDQFTGYLAYSKASARVTKLQNKDKLKEPQIKQQMKLLPILAEAN